MQCHICKKNNASIHYIETINNNIREYYICKDCAEKQGLNKTVPQLKISILDIFLGLIDIENNLELIENKKCPTCNTSLSALHSSNRTGCRDCYEIFDKYLQIVKRKAHISFEHRGKVPKRYIAEANYKKELSYLKLNLRKAIVNENYEEAAKLRDKINDRQKKYKTQCLSPCEYSVKDIHGS